MKNATTAVRALDMMVDQLSRCLTPESARRVVDFKLDAETQTHIAALGEKANEGTITDEEREEYKSYIEIADFIAILKLKARRQLTTKTGA